jgi:amino acid transporter
MAREGLLPSALGRVLPNRRTPALAIIATTAAAALLTFTGTLEVLAETVVLLLLLVFLSTNVAVLVLKKERVEAEHFRIHPLVPSLAIVSCLILLAQQPAGNWLRACALLAVGGVLYALARRYAAKTVPAQG